MKGRVLGFSADTGNGVISAEDGQRYTFTTADWRPGQPREIGKPLDRQS